MWVILSVFDFEVHVCSEFLQVFDCTLQSGSAGLIFCPY